MILQAEKLSDFLRGKSKFFHSIMINGKKEIMKKLYFVFRKVMLCIFPVESDRNKAKEIFRILIS